VRHRMNSQERTSGFGSLCARGHAGAARVWRLSGAGLLGGLLLWSPASAFEQRPGTFSLGLQGGAGVLSGQGEFKPGLAGTPIAYDNFFGGGALSIHLRYSLDKAHAIGFTFEDLRFERKSDFGAPVPPQYQVNSYMADYYLYLNRRAKACSYAVLGAGMHRDTFRPDTIVPGSFVANFGLGLEYFIGPPLALDATARGYYLQGKGGSSVAGGIQLGFQYYILN
jgi:hypothetical protein